MTLFSSQNFAKSILTIILSISFIGSLIWLWQRQPRPSQVLQEQDIATDSAQPQDDQALSLKTADNAVVNSKNLKIEGKASPNQYIAIYQNNSQGVTKSNNSGNFQKETELSDGLNLISVAAIGSSDQQQSVKNLTVYLTLSAVDAKIVFAGSVKNVFDTLVTVAANGLDKNIRTSKSTEFIIPDADEGVEPAVEDIRIGDFALALGNWPENTKDNDTIIARSLEIIRVNKPQNTINVAQIKIISPVRQNIFSASVTFDVTTNISEEKVLEFTLDKNSDIKLTDKDAKSTDITKDKNAIVFYHTDQDENIIDLLYLLL